MPPTERIRSSASVQLASSSREIVSTRHSVHAPTLQSRTCRSECTGAQVHRCTGAQVHRCTGAQVHRRTQVHRCTGAQVHRCTGAQAQRCEAPTLRWRTTSVTMAPCQKEAPLPSMATLNSGRVLSTPT